MIIHPVSFLKFAITAIGGRFSRSERCLTMSQKSFLFRNSIIRNASIISAILTPLGQRALQPRHDEHIQGDVDDYSVLLSPI